MKLNKLSRLSLRYSLIIFMLFLVACVETPFADKYGVSHLISSNQDSLMQPDGFPACLDGDVDEEDSKALDTELRAVKTGPGEFKLYGTINPSFKGRDYTNLQNFMRALFGEAPKTIIIHCVYGSIKDSFNNALIRHLRKIKVNTKMLSNSRAFSGGVDLFMAGVKRTMAEGSKLGVHSWGSINIQDPEGKNVPLEDAQKKCAAEGVKGGDKEACIKKLTELGYKISLKEGRMFKPLDRSNPNHKTYVDLTEDMGVLADFYWLTLEAGFNGSLWLHPKVAKKLQLTTE